MSGWSCISAGSRDPAGGNGVVTGVLSNMGEWRAELDKWREKADRDELTGLYNRAFFERWVTRKLESADLERGSLIFIDVDNFKEINDRYGHLAGDEILRFIAQKILGSVPADGRGGQIRRGRVCDFREFCEP